MTFKCEAAEFNGSTCQVQCSRCKAPDRTRRAADQLERATLASVVDKVARKYDRLAAWAKADPDAMVTMKLTVGELRQLKQFHTRFYDEPAALFGDSGGTG